MDRADFEDFFKRGVKRKRVLDAKKLNATPTKGSSVAREKLPVAVFVAKT
jgi:hypothetical protein